MAAVFTKEFTEEITRIDNALLKKWESGLRDDKELLKRTLKLSEEVGELSEAVLSYIGDQRQEKLDAFDKADLDTEIADVIITALIVARYRDRHRCSDYHKIKKDRPAWRRVIQII